jgi:hypothetical protein
MAQVGPSMVAGWAVATEPEEQSRSASTATVPAAAVAATRRLGESFVVAVITSTGLYLIGSVYTDAYYARMSIDVNSLDLSPTFIGLQSTHVLQSLLAYPSTLVSFYILYWLLSRWRWFWAWAERLRQRFERLVLLLVNLAVIAPLVIDGMLAIIERSVPGHSAVGELSALLANVILVLLGYVIWLSFGPRHFLVSEIRRRRVLPIVVVGLAYLLGALITTADTGARAAEVFMLGRADSSLVVEFTARGEHQAAQTDVPLLLVTARHGNYYVVEHQTFPPSPRPNAYVVPFDAVDFAHLRRLTEAQVELPTIDEETISINLDFSDDEPVSGVSSPVTP